MSPAAPLYSHALPSLGVKIQSARGAPPPRRDGQLFPPASLHSSAPHAHRLPRPSLLPPLPPSPVCLSCCLSVPVLVTGALRDGGLAWHVWAGVGRAGRGVWGRLASLAGIWSTALSVGPLQTYCLPSLVPPHPHLGSCSPVGRRARVLSWFSTGGHAQTLPPAEPLKTLSDVTVTGTGGQLPSTEHALPTEHVTHLSFNLPTTSRGASISPPGADSITPLCRRGNRGTERSGTGPSLHGLVSGKAQTWAQGADARLPAVFPSGGCVTPEATSHGASRPCEGTACGFSYGFPRSHVFAKF